MLSRNQPYPYLGQTKTLAQWAIFFDLDLATLEHRASVEGLRKADVFTKQVIARWKYTTDDCDQNLNSLRNQRYRAWRYELEDWLIDRFGEMPAELAPIDKWAALKRWFKTWLAMTLDKETRDAAVIANTLFYCPWDRTLDTMSVTQISENLGLSYRHVSDIVKKSRPYIAVAVYKH